MSFPRAKIHRFNDIKACTPSPADYNVVKERAKGALIPQSDRFNGASSSTASDTESVKSTPCFRAPTYLPKNKRPKASSISKLDGKVPICKAPKEDELLREKIVECKNKDEFIRELNEQIEDLKEKLNELEKQKQNMNVSITVDETNEHRYHEELGEMSKRHEESFRGIQEEIVKVKENFIRNEYEKLKGEKKEEMDKLLQNMDKFEKLYKESVAEYNWVIDQKNAEIKQKDQELVVLEDNCIELQRKHALDIENLQREHKNELQDVEYEMLKSMTEMQKTLEEEKAISKKKIKELKMAIEEERGRSEREKNLLINDYKNKFQQMEENFTDLEQLKEIQLKEKLQEVERSWQLKLEQQQMESAAVLKECQEISVNTIFETEIEKNRISQQLLDTRNELDEVKSVYENLKQKYRALETDYDKKYQELSNLIVNFDHYKEECVKEREEQLTVINELLSEKKTYQITITTNQDTISVLKKRLINSDKDVEQLKRELTLCEETILNQESRCNELVSELEKAKLANEELEMQNESTLEITRAEIAKLKSELLGKVSQFRQISKESVAELAASLDIKNLELVEVFQQLRDSTRLNEEAQKLIAMSQTQLETLEASLQEHQEQIKRLSEVNADIEVRMAKLLRENEEFKQEKEKLEFENANVKEMHHGEKANLEKQIAQLQVRFETSQKCCEDYKQKIQKQEIEIEEQKKQTRLQDSLIGPFRAQLETFELEMKSLASEKRYIENEANQLASKYADILGHQNHKQKIKHLNDLKEKNEALRSAKIELESKVRSQKRIIEKLSKEVEELKKMKKLKLQTEKENIPSPNRSFNVGKMEKVESPNPLKEKN